MSLALSTSTPNSLIVPDCLRSQAENGAQQHRFAGARGADKAEDLAAPDVERQLVEDQLVAEGDGDVVRGKHDVALVGVC